MTTGPQDPLNLPARLERDRTQLTAVQGSALDLTIGQEYLEYVDLDPDQVSAALSKVMDVPTCRRLQAVPIAADEVEVTIALANAADLMMLDDLRARFAPREVTFTTADPEVLDKILERWAAINAKEAETAAVRELTGDAANESEVREAADDSGKMAQLVSRLFEQAIAAGASDVHFEPTDVALVVRFRVDGVLVVHERYPLSIAQGVINRIKVMSRIEIAERRIPQDGRFHRTFAGKEVDCRVVTLPVSTGYEGAVIRLLDQSRSSLALSEVGLSPVVHKPLTDVLSLPHGMVLVTGPTGSGKTTTLYAALGEVASSDRKVLTVEDPVEIRFPSVTQMQVNERAGLTFAAALKSFLRADPDVILVGEIRDRETAELASQAALTGHLVLSTLHTNEASGAPTRLSNMGLEGFVVASALKAIMAQRLLRRLCTRCSEPYLPKQSDLEMIGWAESGLPVPDQLWRPSGVACDACKGRGYRGRLAAAEMVVVNDDLADAIAHVAPSIELEKIARASGSVSLHNDALGWVVAGATSIAELRRVGV